MSDKTGERDNPFVPALAVGGILVGFIAFLAWIGLGAFEGDYRTGNDGNAHALSKSAVGYAGLVTLLNAMKREAVVVRSPFAPCDPDTAMLIVTVDEGRNPIRLESLPVVRGFPGPILTVMPKWSTVPALRRGWVRQNGRATVDLDGWLGTDEDRSVLRKAGKAKVKPRFTYETHRGKSRHLLSYANLGETSLRINTGEIENYRTFKTHPDWEPVIVDENGEAVVISYDDGRLFALAEPDLLNNHGLSDAATARAGLMVLSVVSINGPVYLDVTLNGLERTRSLLKLMLQPPFLGATLCALAAALMMIWQALWRFGQAARGSRAFALGKTALADNQAGLIRMAARQHRMGGGYAALVRDLVARAVAAPRDLAGAGLEALLDRLGRGHTTEAHTDIAAAADRAANNTQLMDAAQRLHRWRLEMTRESR